MVIEASVGMVALEIFVEWAALPAIVTLLAMAASVALVAIG